MRPVTGPNTFVLYIGGPIAPADIKGLCRRLRVLLQDSDADLVICDVSALAGPDAVAVDALARLQLTARRCGCQVLLRHACGELRELLVLTGLSDVVCSTDEA
jgi:ABC-type transporter Mla MlaB component